jgi:hypothetical protein
LPRTSSQLYLNVAVRSGSNGRRERGEDFSPALGFQRVGGSGVDVGGDAGLPGNDEGGDEVQEIEACSGVCLARLGASRIYATGWLEGVGSYRASRSILSSLAA